MRSVEITSGFSFRRFMGLLARILELAIIPALVINLLWLFALHRYTAAEIIFAGYIEILTVAFLLAQFARLFLDWRGALCGIGRALVYALVAGITYL
jgi:hypothetical protein